MWLTLRYSQVDTVLACMKTHQAEPRVEEHGCAVLRNLSATHCGLHQEIGASQGEHDVIQAMATHKSDQAVAVQACAALRNLASDQENRQRIIRACGIRAVVEVM